MENIMFLVLALLFVKHWYVDFVNQTMEEVQWKGTYLDWRGVKHSVKHGVATAIIFYLCSDPIFEPSGAILIGLIDFILHYHIDWAKININKHNNYTVENPKFWTWLGADQLAHSLTYLLLVWTFSWYLNVDLLS